MTAPHSNGSAPDSPAPAANVRKVSTPAAAALADLAGIFEELQTVLRCCERLVGELGRTPVDDTGVEALWTTAVLSYARCFTPGPRGMGLTEKDLGELELQGDVVEWDAMLRRLPAHYADPAVNPREIFSVGVSLSPDGGAEGVALTSIRQPHVDDQTVRQTGALAYALSELVDRRIAEQLEVVSKALAQTPRKKLAALPVIEVAPVPPGPPTNAPAE